MKLPGSHGKQVDDLRRAKYHRDVLELKIARLEKRLLARPGVTKKNAVA